MECIYTSYLIDQIGLGFNIRSKLGDRHIGLLHKHHFFEIIIVLDGNYSIFIPNKPTVTIQKNMMLITEPDTPHISDASGMNIQFAISTQTISDISNYLYSGRPINMKNCSVYSLSNNQTQFIKSQVQFASLLSPHDMENKKTIIRRMLVEIFDDIICPVSDQIQPTYIDMPVWFKELLSKYENLEILSGGLKQMQTVTKMSEEYICRCFKKYLGITPTEFINNRKMQYAANMLKYSNMKIIQICEDLGMSSISYFCKLFKENYGVSPLKYRKGAPIKPKISHKL